MTQRPATPAAPAWVQVLQAAPQGHRLRGLGTLACLEYAHDGERLATGGNLGVVLWHLRERRVLARLAPEVAPVLALAFSPDGTRLAALGRGDVVALCDLASGLTTDIIRLRDDDDDDSGDVRMQFSPDGASLLVMGEDQSWLVVGGRARRLGGEDGPLGEELQVAGFSSAGELVVLEERVTAFYAPDLRRLRQIAFAPGSGLCAVSGDGRFLLAPPAGAGRSRFALVSLETGELLTTLRLDDAHALRLAARAPLLLADGRSRPRLHAFPARPGAGVPALAHEGRLDDFEHGDLWALAPTGDVVAIGDSYRGSITLQPTDGGEPPLALGTYIYDSDSAVSLLALDARGAWALVFGMIGDGQNSSAWAQGWDLAGDRPGQLFSDDMALFCTAAALVPGTELVAMPQSSAGVLLADRHDDSEAQILYDEDALQNVAVSPDGSLVAAGSGSGVLVLWHRESGRQLARLQAHDEQLCGLAWRDDHIATTSQDGTLRLWSAAALLAAGPRATPRSTTALGGMLYQAVFSPDGSLCAVGTAGGQACVVRTEDGALVARPGGHTGEVMALAFHPGTGELVTGGLDGRLRVWNPESGELLGELLFAPAREQADAGVTGMSFDADGRVFALSHLSGALRLWDLPAS